MTNTTLTAQNKAVHVDVAYGFSDFLRNDNKSYYDYTLSDYRLNVGIAKPLSKWNFKGLKVYKGLDVRFISSDYFFESESVKSNPFRVEVHPNISVSKGITNDFFIHLKCSIGAGYGKAYYKRLPNGFFFAENISLGFSYSIDKTTSIGFATEYQHISNLNFYKLNKGLDLNFIHINLTKQIL